MTDVSSSSLPRRCGFIALVGRPNVGKSTLLNCLINARISITSQKAQTTRYRVLGVLTENEDQFVFVDTPGFQTRFRSKLNARMNQVIGEVLSDVDMAVVVLEAGKDNEVDNNLLRQLPKDKPVIAVINKVDTLHDRGLLLPQIDTLAKRFPFAALIPVSAEKGWQIGLLKKELAQHLPEGPWLYEADDLTDRDDRFIAAEFIREKIFRLLGDEIPYSTHVVINSFTTEGNVRVIESRIYVEREGQRAVLLGHQGQVIKRISTEARQEMERLWGNKVFLTTRVVVRPDWMNDVQMLRRFELES